MKASFRSEQEDESKHNIGTEFFVIFLAIVQ